MFPQHTRHLNDGLLAALAQNDVKSAFLVEEQNVKGKIIYGVYAL